MKKTISILLAGMFISSVSFADTVVTIKEGSGELQTISIRNDFVRMGGGEEEYMIADMKAGIVYVVMPSERQILELTSKGSSSASQVKSSLKEKGKGPKIAGYATKEYTLMANGENCGSLYISKKAAKNPDIKKLIAIMDKLNPESMMPEGMGSMMQGMMDVCSQASANSLKDLASLGMPMKMTGGSGELDNEVVKIDSSVKLSASLFALPKDYKRTTPAGLMNNAMKEMQDALKNISPEQQQMMQQMMKQFGGMGQ